MWLVTAVSEMVFCAVCSLTKPSRNLDFSNRQNILWQRRIRQGLTCEIVLGVGCVPLLWRHLLSVERGHGVPMMCLYGVSLRCRRPTCFTWLLRTVLQQPVMHGLTCWLWELTFQAVPLENNVFSFAWGLPAKKQARGLGMLKSLSCDWGAPA